MFKDAAVIQGQAELSDVEQALNEVKASNEAVAAELNVRLNAARAAGDRAAQHALWREREVRQAEGQAKVDELTRSLNPVGFRFDALKSLWSSAESTKRETPNDLVASEAKSSAKAVNEELTKATLSSLATVDTSESVSAFATQVAQRIGDLSATEAYAVLTEATLSFLATVDTPESASAFATQVAQQIRDLSARIPEFYALEFFDMFKDAVVNLTNSDMENTKRALNEVLGRNEAVAAELNVRLNAARAAGDRAAQHALWREREVRQAEGQAKVDELTRSLNPVGFRFDALREPLVVLGHVADPTAIQAGIADNEGKPTPLRTYRRPFTHFPSGDSYEPRSMRRSPRLSSCDKSALPTPSALHPAPMEVLTSSRPGAVAQVKTHMKPIGRPDLQRLSGVAKGRTTLFFSLEGYTPEARKWGD